MNEVLEFLNDNSVFYIATVDGDTPKVRPFGFAMEFNGMLCFATSNKKEVYAQLKANPKAEICTTSKTGEWLRLKGTAVFVTSSDAKQAAFAAMPSLREIYGANDTIFEIFTLENGEATFCSMAGGSKTIKL